ncbi:hypothetical protein HA466_0241810 [Hirschfeldia incana]|nr:hypothetical protein HA466_0241810 [Hirschfeldia incana]KAJ0238059.1 hypothetical protein HA466_0241810 [Hirschfeldia incana]
MVLLRLLRPRKRKPTSMISHRRRQRIIQLRKRAKPMKPLEFYFKLTELCKSIRSCKSRGQPFKTIKTIKKLKGQARDELV